jgi:hypothetical protein
LEFNLAYKGDRFRIRIAKTSVTITPGHANAREHDFLVAGRPVKCGPGKPVVLDYRPAKSSTSNRRTPDRSRSFATLPDGAVK